MLKKFYIDNFKSLVDFEVELSHFNCLIGLNGVGKSTLLQAIDFACALMLGDVKNWLSKRGWEAKELNSTLEGLARNITLGFEVEIDNENYRWEAVFNRDKLACTKESVTRISDSAVLFSLKEQVCRGNLPEQKPFRVNFIYEGSVLSRLKHDWLGDELNNVAVRICSLRSMDLLSPQLLRKKAKRAEEGDIGMGGEHLSAFIHELSNEQQQQLLKQLKSYYPQICSLKTKALRAGWIQLEITEQYSNGNNEPLSIVTEACHINDGMLRLLAILAQQFSPLETLLFDEIENGINPEITELVVDALVASPKQAIVTTHSPMVLNYLEDDVARQSVTLLYKRPDGRTQACRFFEIPSASQKLDCLAAGDAMLDLSLNDMAIEAEQIRSASHVL